MSVDYTAVIARGFLIDECPYGNLPDEFIDKWVIDFDCYDEHDTYLIGYYIQRCVEGYPFEMNLDRSDEFHDNLLSEACRMVGIPVGEIKTYFGVRVS